MNVEASFRRCRWCRGRRPTAYPLREWRYLYGKKRLREIDRRMRFLTKRLDIAEVVDPAAQPNRDQGPLRRHRALHGPRRGRAHRDHRGRG